MATTLTIDVTEDINPFTRKHLGFNISPWTFAYSDGFGPPGNKRNAMIRIGQELKIGAIRYAGGLASQNTGWTRNESIGIDGGWSSGGNNYSRSYKPSTIDQLASFCTAIGAEVMIEMNVSESDPNMWADMLRWARLERGYSHFTMWELGNEQSLSGGHSLSISTYVSRLNSYNSAMRAVFSNFKMLAPVPHQPYLTAWIDAVKNNNAVNMIAVHWYQLTEWTSNTGAFAYQGGSVEALLEWEDSIGSSGGFNPNNLSHITYRRQMPNRFGSDIINPILANRPNMEFANSEWGVHASQHTNPINSNHLAAIWMADVLPAWAEGGTDVCTYHTLEDGSTSGGSNSRGICASQSSSAASIRPLFSTYWLFAQFFGNMIVECLNSRPDKEVNGHAARFTNDPTRLAVMVTNMLGSSDVVTLNISGLTIIDGRQYVMTTDDGPLDVDNASYVSGQTDINGIRVPNQMPWTDTDVLFDVLDQIRPGVAMANPSEITMPPYSAAMLVLRTETITEPPPDPPIPAAPAMDMGAGALEMIVGGSIDADWTDWSWGEVVVDENQNQVRVVHNAASGALQLNYLAPSGKFDMTDREFLKILIHATQAQLMGLSTYGYFEEASDPTPIGIILGQHAIHRGNNWWEVTIPKSVLQLSNEMVARWDIRNDTGGPITYYINEMGWTELEIVEPPELPPSNIDVTTQPFSVQSGSPVGGPPTVRVTNANGEGVEGVTVTVTVNKGEFQSGTLSVVTDFEGYAVFDDLIITLIDTGYRLTFTVE